MLLMGAFGLLDGVYMFPIVFTGSIAGSIYSFWKGQWFPGIAFFIIACLMYIAMKNYGGGGSLFNFKLPLPKWVRR